MLSSLAMCILYLLLYCVCTPDFATVYAEFIKTLILMESTLAAENEVRFLTHIVYSYYKITKWTLNKCIKTVCASVQIREIDGSKMLKSGNGYMEMALLVWAKEVYNNFRTTCSQWMNSIYWAVRDALHVQAAANSCTEAVLMSSRRQKLFLCI